MAVGQQIYKLMKEVKFNFKIIHLFIQSTQRTIILVTKKGESF